MRVLVGVGLMVLALVQPAAANPIVIDFEDQPDSFGNQLFPTSYQGVSWTAGHWLHYAPYEPNGYDPDGVNAIYAASVAGGNSFTFTDAVFAGASFSAPLIFDPRFTSRIFFELYDNGILVHTSADLSSGALTFLSSGYGGLVDEVRVITLANGGTNGSLMTAGGSAWIMDNVTVDFNPNSTPVPDSTSTLVLLSCGLVSILWKRRRTALPDLLKKRSAIPVLGFVVTVALTTPATANANTMIYSDSLAFQAALGASVTDDYSAASYQHGNRTDSTHDILPIWR